MGGGGEEGGRGNTERKWRDERGRGGEGVAGKVSGGSLYFF